MLSYQSWAYTSIYCFRWDRWEDKRSEDTAGFNAASTILEQLRSPKKMA